MELGAGEILLTSVDCEGLQRGMDLELIRAVTEAVDVPVICGGGVGCARTWWTPPTPGPAPWPRQPCCTTKATVPQLKADIRAAGVEVRVWKQIKVINYGRSLLSVQRAFEHLGAQVGQ